MDVTIPIAALAAIGGGGYALDRLGLWLERRGWLYYRTRRGSVPLGRAVLETQAMLDPSKRYMLEATRTSPDDSASADPPSWNFLNDVVTTSSGTLLPVALSQEMSSSVK